MCLIELSSVSLPDSFESEKQKFLNIYLFSDVLYFYYCGNIYSNSLKLVGINIVANAGLNNLPKAP